ncbi:hypothetical protein ACOSQ3_019077 [Xanthoceras sorbifolium]
MDDSFVFSAPPMLEKMMDMSTKDGVSNFHCKRAKGFCDDSTGSAPRGETVKLSNPENGSQNGFDSVRR